MFQQMTEQVCEQCQNVKFEREGYFVTVDIEQGMEDGQEVVFYEDGEPIIDGEPGDLKFRIHTASHDHFRREGNDLHATVTITLDPSSDLVVLFCKDVETRAQSAHGTLKVNEIRFPCKNHLQLHNGAAELRHMSPNNGGSEASAKTWINYIPVS